MAAEEARKVMAIMDVLSSSSSSSDDQVTITALTARNKRCRMRNFVQFVHEFSEEESFRLERQTVYILIERYEASEFYPSDLTHGGSLPLSAEHDFLSFLWFAGNKVSLRDVALRFGVASSTTFNQINRIMDFLVHIAPNVIKFPEDKEQAAFDFFTIARFPDTLGCIDGTSITIRTPVNKLKSTYVNRHDIPALTLQGICDSKKRFIDVSVGAPAKIHDARVFQLSDISEKLPAICNRRYHVIGDAAYPIREWLLVPFRDYGNLSEEQKLYTKRFCSTRVLIENTFGLLKGRFRQLLEVHMYEVDKISKFILSCCVVHNCCIEFNDQCNFEPVVNNVNDMPFDDDHPDQLLKILGERKRNNVMRALNDDNE